MNKDPHLLTEVRPKLPDIPHNLCFEEVGTLIEEARRLDMNISIMCIKPQCREFDARLVETVLPRLLQENALMVLCTACKTLTAEEVMDLYADIFEDKGLESEFIEDHRLRILDYMASGSMFSMLVCGDHGSGDVHEIRRVFRENYCPDEILKNAIHVPDDGEFNANLHILFGQNE
jgi:hypothetical protein